MSKTFVRNDFISSSISNYIASHTSEPDAVQTDLRQITRDNISSLAQMQIGDDQSIFMEILVRAIGARRAVEIGTFTGMSSIAIARGLGPSGRLLCCDVSEEWTAYARQAWERAGIAERIELRLAPAIETLRSLPANTKFDFAFIDADKTGYLDYYETLLPLMRVSGIILVDNTLQDGRVVDPSHKDKSTVAIREFNDRLMNDSRIRCVLLSIGDGLTMIEKR